MPNDQATVRGSVLQEAMDATLKSRHKVYGDPYTDMACAAELMAVFNRHAKGRNCAAHDEAIGRVMIKLARIACGAPGHRDSYADLAAYIAIAFECYTVDQVHIANKKALAPRYTVPAESVLKGWSAPGVVIKVDNLELAKEKKARGIGGDELRFWKSAPKGTPGIQGLVRSQNTSLDEIIGSVNKLGKAVSKSTLAGKHAKALSELLPLFDKYITKEGEEAWPRLLAFLGFGNEASLLDLSTEQLNTLHAQLKDLE